MSLSKKSPHSQYVKDECERLLTRLIGDSPLPYLTWDDLSERAQSLYEDGSVTGYSISQETDRETGDLRWTISVMLPPRLTNIDVSITIDLDS